MIQTIDLVAGAVMVGYTVSGVARGLALTALWMIGALTSFVLAVLAPKYLSVPVASCFDINRLVAGFCISLIAMFLVSIAFSIVRLIILRRRLSSVGAGKDKLSTVPLPARSRFLGGVLGGLYGILIVSALGWCYDAVQAAVPSARVPDASKSTTERVSQKVVYGGVYLGVRWATHDATKASVAASLICCPSRAIHEVVAFVNEPTIQRLRVDRTFYADFLSGDTARLGSDEALRKVFADGNAMGRLQTMGLIPRGGSEQIVSALAAIGGRLQKIATDPDIQKARDGLQKDGLLDPEGASKLLKDPRFLSILDRMTRGGSD